MCRIAGVIERNGTREVERVKAMCDAMYRGGPDDHGIFEAGHDGVVLGNRRLAIQDLTQAGHQPMISQDGSAVITFNGEIYNFLQLRSSLATLGHQFSSRSDTEVILKAYEEWGEEAFAKLHGIFAIAIWDNRSGELVLARDRSGIKPLYLFLDEQRLIFASEIRGFRAAWPEWTEDPDWRIYFLSLGYLPGTRTTLQGVRQLERGTVMRLNVRSWKTHSTQFHHAYYNYRIHSVEEAVGAVTEALSAAVNAQMISDAPLGVFLSGGLDSSILTLLAQEHESRQLQSISVAFDEERFSEQRYQDLLTRHLQVRSHQQVIRQQDFIDAIPDILAAMDQPSIDGINTYFISRVAREAGVKAVLSGIGADELFGGYPSFGRADHSSWMNAVPDLVRRLGRYVGDDRLRKVEFPGFGRGFGTYLLHRGLFTPSRVSWLLDTSESDVRGALHKLYESIPEFVEYLEPLEQVSYLESAMYMQYQLLKDADYMGMWHGLEIRVPFLHETVLDTVQSIAPEIKYHPDLAKHLLIKAFGSRLPLEIWNRPKQGFTFPFEVWMKQLNEVHSPLPQLDGYHHQLVQGRMYWSRYWAALLSKM